MSSAPSILRWRLAAALIVALLLAVGGPAPSLWAQGADLQGLGGERLREADLASGTTIAVVFASWSPRCRDIDRQIGALAGRWGSRARVVAVSFQEERGEVEAFLAGKGVRVPVFLDPDGAFSKKHAITFLPGLVVIQNGRAAYAGKLPDDPDRLLSDLLG